MLVFGIATAVTTIHRVLPHAVSSVLAIERFQSQPSHICVLEIINKVIKKLLNYKTCYIQVRKCPASQKPIVSKEIMNFIACNAGVFCCAINFDFQLM